MSSLHLLKRRKRRLGGRTAPSVFIRSRSIWLGLLAQLITSSSCLAGNTRPHYSADSEAHRENMPEFDAYASRFLMPQDFDLAEKIPVPQPNAELMNSIQNEDLFEGDIVGSNPLSGFQRRLRDSLPDETIFSRPYHNAINTDIYSDRLWPNGRVPYVMEDLMTKMERAAIAQAFDEYRNKTCIQFVPRQDADKDYIYIKRNVAYGCSSSVGRAGGKQEVSLETHKCFLKGVIVHELMHALGFFHEHSRTNRDDYIDVIEENIRPGMLRNFEKYPSSLLDSLGMPYDYDSIMHYNRISFSVNGKPTIMPKDPTAEIGQRIKLSKIDAIKLNKLYACAVDNKVVSPEEPTTTSILTTTTSTMTTSTTTTPVTEPLTTTDVEEELMTEESTITTTEPSTTSTTTEFTITIGLPREIYHVIRPKIQRPPPMSRYVKPNRWVPPPELSVPSKQVIHSTTTGTPPTTSSTTENECVNLNAHCDMWEQLGHCRHSKKYMSHYCKRSCNLCSSGDEEKKRKPKETVVVPHPKKCVDRNLFCGYWARMGKCKNESKSMRYFCRRSCGVCDE